MSGKSVINQWLEVCGPEVRCEPPEDLVGWRGEVALCANCAARLVNRGFNFGSYVDEPIWAGVNPVRFDCQFCGTIYVRAEKEQAECLPS